MQCSRCPQLSRLLDYHVYPHHIVPLRVAVSTCQRHCWQVTSLNQRSATDYSAINTSLVLEQQSLRLLKAPCLVATVWTPVDQCIARSTSQHAGYNTKVGMYYCLTFMCYSAPMNFTQLRLQLSSCVLTTALIFPSGNISSSCEK